MQNVSKSHSNKVFHRYVLTSADSEQTWGCREDGIGGAPQVFWYTVSQFFLIFKIYFVCFVVVLFDLVHDVEAIHDLF